MKNKAQGSRAPDDQALMRLEWQQRLLDGIVAEGARISEILLKRIKAGAPDSPALMEAYLRIARAVRHTAALSRRLEEDAAGIGTKQPGEPRPDNGDGPWRSSRSAMARVSPVRERLEREFLADALARSPEKPDRLH